MTNDLETLPLLIKQAMAALDGATTAAEVLDARDYAKVAYDAAKSAARFLKAKGAHATILAACHQLQADALTIEALAQSRLANEYEAAQERGEVHKHGGQGKRDIPDKNIHPVTDMGLTSKQIHEARTVRNAEKRSPGIVKKTLDAKLEAGEEPTRADVNRAVAAQTNGHTDPGDDDAAAADTPDNSESEFAPPEQIEENVLFAIARVADNARAVRKILKAPALDREAFTRINTAIDEMIKKWRSIQSTLEGAPRKLAPAALAARRKRKANNKISDDYGKRFGGFSTVINPDVLRRMKASLQSGIDQFAELKAERECDQDEYVREETLKRAALNAPLLAPITPKKEKAYTRLIKARQLYEGACDLSWEQYFKYRDEHPDLPPLTPDDLEYAGMWTACAVPPN
jgi:hypothetical protein